MNRLLLLISLTATIILTGCSTSVPDCGDEKTTSLVKETALKMLLGDETKNLSDMFNVELGAVQTVEHLKDPEKYSCKAEIKITTSGKLGELFGNADDIVARIRGGTLTAVEIKELDALYKELAMQLLFNPAWALNGETDVFKIAASASILKKARTIEFVSTSAKQDGQDRHLIEIRPFLGQTQRVVELAKFSKTYARPATTVAASAVSEAKPVIAQDDLSQIFPSKDCAKPASSAARLICSTPELIALDEELLKIYLAALANHPDRAEKIREQEMDLIEPRDSCSEVDCLRALYNVRKEMLK